MALALVESYSTDVGELDVDCFAADLECLKDRLRDCGGSAW
jgi:hypothetical protein